MDSQLNPYFTPNLSLWRRIFAFSIDLALLECLSLILGWFFGDVFASWGRWGNLIGFGLTVLYFGVCNSHWGNGQTPGKRITKIKAIAKNEKMLPLSYSLNQNPQTKVLQIKIDLKQKSSDLSVLRKNVTDIVFRSYPHIKNFDTIGLTTYYGYTIGLAMGYQKQNYRYCPIAGKLEFDRQFDRHLFLKTLGFFELDWNLESSRPVFIQFPFFTYGAEPKNFSSVARTANSLGNCLIKK